MYLIAGLGKTGYSIAGYLSRRNKPFAVFDTRLEPLNADAFYRNFPGVQVFLGEVPDNLYNELTDVIVSPGVDITHPAIKKAINLNIPVYGDVECLAREIDSPVIAITGTNGKSTVTSLVGEMAKQAGIEVAVAGNIGNPVLDLLDDGHKYALWVLELSSFQLDLINSLKPLGATILNISPDHIDRHGSMESYIAAKQRIYHNATYVVYNRDDKLTFLDKKYEVDDQIVVSYGLDEIQGFGIRKVENELYIAHGEYNLLPITGMKLQGMHNVVNALAACALANIIGISYTVMCKVLAEFNGLSHRCVLVRTLDGVDWVDDSKGTNVGATVAAIRGLGKSISGKIILIAGGQGKGADFTLLRDSVKNYVKHVILIGEDAGKIADAIQNIVDIVNAESMHDAILQAKSLACSKDMVLLSPACASFDMFKDFNHRGDVFTKMVLEL